jgi:hypothetical protein
MQGTEGGIRFVRNNRNAALNRGRPESFRFADHHRSIGMRVVLAGSERRSAAVLRFSLLHDYPNRPTPRVVVLGYRIPDFGSRLPFALRAEAGRLPRVHP